MASSSDPKMVVWILWGALLTSVLMYGVIGYVQQPPSAQAALPMLTQVLGGMALATAVATYALRPVLAKQVYFSYLIVRWALMESIAIYGLVLRFLGAELQVMLAFNAVTVLLFVLNAPTQDAFDRYTDAHGSRSDKT